MRLAKTYFSMAVNLVVEGGRKYISEIIMKKMTLSETLSA